MAQCKSQKYVGRDIIVEYAIGCGDALPLENEWRPIGAMRAKEFTLEWETTDATAGDSLSSLRENLATFQTLSVSGDGVCKASGTGAAELIELTKHVVNPVSTAGQPLAWIRFTFPDLTFIALMIVSNMSRSAPHDDVVTYSFAASATTSDFGLIVEDTPDADAVDPTSVETIPAALQLMIGEQFALQSIVEPVGVSQAVRYASSAANIAPVGQVSGVVRGLAVGSATITTTSAIDPGVFDTVAVTVVPLPASITVAPNPVTVAESGTQTLTPTVLPAGAPSGVTYTSLNPAVATVSSGGTITGVLAGVTAVRVASVARPGVFVDVPVTVTT